MKLICTVQDIIEHGLWEKFCIRMGWDATAAWNIDFQKEIELDVEEAKELGLI